MENTYTAEEFAEMWKCIIKSSVNDSENPCYKPFMKMIDYFIDHPMDLVGQKISMIGPYNSKEDVLAFLRTFKRKEGLEHKTVMGITMEELELIVPSESVRKYVVDTGYMFSDWQRAALLYHNDMCIRQRLQYLQVIQEETADETLKDQIRRYIRTEEERLRLFKQNPDNKYVYLLKYHIEDYDNEMYFLDYEIAYRYGRRCELPYTIRKYEGVTKENIPVFDKESIESGFEEIASISVDQNGKIHYISSLELDADTEGYLDDIKMNKKNFTFMYYEVPNPFNKGDIVKLCDLELYGVVHQTQEEWQAYKKNVNDFSDVGIFISILEPDGSFFSEIENTVMLEKYDVKVTTDENFDAVRDSLLASVAMLYKGEGCLEDISTYTTKYRELNPDYKG